MSNQEAKYFDLLTTGLGYINRVREVTPEEGNPFLSVTLAALRGSADNAQYTHFECRVAGKQAKAVHTLMSQVINQLHLIPKKAFWEDDGMPPTMFSDGLTDFVFAERKGDRPEDITSLTAWIRGHNAELLDQLPDEQAIAAVISKFNLNERLSKLTVPTMARRSSTSITF